MKDKKQTSIFSLLLLIAFVASGALWLKPNIDKASMLKLTEGERLKTYEQLQADLKNLQSAQANISAAGEVEKTTVLSAIPENYEQDKLINLITEIARKNDVNIGSISFSIPFTSNEPIKKGGLSISMTGTEADLLRLLKGLENSVRKFVITSITVQLGQMEGVERANFSIAVDTYFQKGI